MSNDTDVRMHDRVKLMIKAFFDVKKGLVRVDDDFEGDFSSPTVDILNANLEKTKGKIEFLWMNENAKLFKERECFEKSLKSEMTTTERKRFLTKKLEEIDGIIESRKMQKEASQKLIEDRHKVLIAIYRRFALLFRKGRKINVEK